MSLFQRRRARGEMFQGYLDIICLSWGQMKAHTLLPTALHPWVAEREECGPLPAARLGWASASSLASTFHGGFTDQGTHPPLSSDHHR